MTFKRFGLMLFLVLCAHPSAAQNREHLQMTADLRMLQEQIARLQVSVNQLSDQLKIVTRKIDDQASATQKGFADQQVLINGIASTNNTIREKIDDNSVRVSQLSQEFKSVQQGLRLLTDQFNALTALLQPPVNPLDPNAVQNAGAAAPGGAVSMPQSPGVVFQAAMNDYTKGDGTSAAEGFEEFLKNFPDSPDAARAQFFLGLSYESMKPAKHQEALDAFGKVIENYKGAPEVPEAYYEQAGIYANLGQTTKAKGTMELIIKQFPNSDRAVLAAQKLKLWAATPPRN